MSLRRFACSDAARQRVDPIGGTAVPTAGWLLVEQPGAWEPNVVASADLDTAVRARLLAAASRAGFRPLLVRRPGRADADGGPERFWAVVDSRPGGRDVRGTWSQDADLLEAVDVLEGRAGTASALPRDPLLLVCTHGRRDVCCAVRGRPVAAALAARWPELTWECTHVGGDRFAANLVVVPSATFYGGLDPDVAVRVVRDHLAGRVDAGYLRGFATCVPVAQAAVVEVHRRFGPLPADGIEVASVEPLSDGAWRVALRPGDGVSGSLAPQVATVVAEAAPPALLTCHALRSTSATVHRVQRLEPG